VHFLETCFSRIGAIVKNAILYRFSKFKLHSIRNYTRFRLIHFSEYLNTQFFFMNIFVRKKIGESGRIVRT